MQSSFHYENVNNYDFGKGNHNTQYCQSNELVNRKKQPVLLQQLIINYNNDGDPTLNQFDSIHDYRSPKHLDNLTNIQYSELTQMNTYLNVHQKESEKKLKQLLNSDRQSEQEQLLLEFQTLQQEKISLAVQLDMLRAQQKIRPTINIQQSYNHVSEVRQHNFNQTPIFCSYSEPLQQSIKSEQKLPDLHTSGIQFQKRDCQTTQTHTESFGKQITHQDIFTPRKANDCILIDTESKVQVQQFTISKEQTLDQSCQCNLLEDNLNNSNHSMKSHIKEKMKYKDQQIVKLNQIIEEQKLNYDKCLLDLEQAHQQICKYQEQETEVKDSNKLQSQYDNLAARYNELKYNNRDPEMEALIRRLQDQIALITNEMKQASIEYKTHIAQLSEQHEFQILQYQNKIKELERDGHSNYHNSSLLQENQFLAQQLSYIQEELTNARQIVKELKEKKTIKTITSNNSTPRMSSKVKIETEKEALTKEVSIWKNKYEQILEQNEGLQEQINEQYSQYESIVLQLQEQINRMQESQKFHHEESFKLVESSHKSQNLLDSYHKSPNFVQIEPKLSNAKFQNSHKITVKKHQRSWSQSSDAQNEASNITSQNTFQTSLVLLQQYEINKIKKLILQKNYEIDSLKQSIRYQEQMIDNNQSRIMNNLKEENQILIQQYEAQNKQIKDLQNMVLFDQLEIIELEAQSAKDQNFVDTLQQELTQIQQANSSQIQNLEQYNQIILEQYKDQSNLIYYLNKTILFNRLEILELESLQEREDNNLVNKLQEQIQQIQLNHAQCDDHESQIISLKLNQSKLQIDIKQLQEDKFIIEQQLEQTQIMNDNIIQAQKSQIFELQRQILKLTKINAQLIQNINNTISTEELNKQLKGKIEDLTNAKETYTNTYEHLQDLESKLISQLEANESRIL